MVILLEKCDVTVVGGITAVDGLKSCSEVRQKIAQLPHAKTNLGYRNTH